MGRNTNASFLHPVRFLRTLAHCYRPLSLVQGHLDLLKSFSKPCIPRRHPELHCFCLFLTGRPPNTLTLAAQVARFVGYGCISAHCDLRRLYLFLFWFLRARSEGKRQAILTFIDFQYLYRYPRPPTRRPSCSWTHFIFQRDPKENKTPTRH